MPGDPTGAAVPQGATPGADPGSSGGGDAGGQAPGSPGATPPGGGPMSIPAQAAGGMAEMQVQGRVVVTLLEKMLSRTGAGTDIGKDVFDALKKMSKHFGQEDPQQRSAAMSQLIQRAMGKGGQPQGGGPMPQPNSGPIPAPAAA